MADSKKIEQNAIFGAQGNTFIGEQHNYSGLTPTDATQIAFSIFREFYPQLRQEALDALSKMLEEKLGKISPNDIVPPKPRIIVPALQDASLTEEQEIRELYAKLLANSMNIKMKDKVHPGYVEIVKQLCPDEAKILGYLSEHIVIPTITLRFEKKDGAGILGTRNFSNVGEITHCERTFELEVYFDNLIRLGLLRASPTSGHLIGDNIYEPLKNHPYIKQLTPERPEYDKPCFSEGFMELTEYGNLFCDICIRTTKKFVLR